jgi:hypothetical protein
MSRHIAQRLLQGAAGLLLLLLCSGLDCAPRVVTGLALVPSIDIGSPPAAVWAEIVDAGTPSESVNLPAIQYGGGVVAADLHGHHVYLGAGGKIEVIDTISNRIETVIAGGEFFRALATDPVRARLYAANDYPQPQVLVTIRSLFPSCRRSCCLKGCRRTRASPRLS